MSSISPTVADLATRRGLAQAITLVESRKLEHRRTATGLIAEAMPLTGNALRIGISGVPGVGKSTFIEAFGLHLIDRGHRVAVLAVDPTSQRTGGSILGDKTRMEQLARNPAAFIRPSPAGRTLGGVARRTREAMLLCEAAGYDVVLVETVGVGQSETAVADMVDLFLLLLLPAGGDELQGIKRGIVELADLVVINKCDGDLQAAANHAAAEYRHALTLLRPAQHGWRTPVVQVSSIEGRGLDQVWDLATRFRAVLERGNTLADKRGGQALAWFRSDLREALLDRLTADPAWRREVEAAEAAVRAGAAAPSGAAAALLDRVLDQRAL